LIVTFVTGGVKLALLIVVLAGGVNVDLRRLEEDLKPDTEVQVP
jgi:hypothetical protein